MQKIRYISPDSRPGPETKLRSVELHMIVLLGFALSDNGLRIPSTPDSLSSLAPDMYDKLRRDLDGGRSAASRERSGNL